MGKINILEEKIANQIAAGEVIERPASIVKELIENSIDAKSTQIVIDIKDSGIKDIRIKDNGEGILEEDIELAFFRHATSKIKNSRDLFKINSLGFRGEALPSIAAVSKIVIKSSTDNSGRGIEVKLEGGNIISKKEISFTRGTELIVSDIFYNTPARLKYMKSLQTELSHITDYINRLSLAYPEISVSFIHNDRQILKTIGNENSLQVLSAIYGINVAKKMLYFENENRDFKISGYLSNPEITRANKQHISIYINGRYIKNYMLTQAIINGYNTLLMINRFPIAILNIDLDFSLVDVNVHPAKLEVRISKENELIKLIEETIYRTLNKESLVREPKNSNKKKELINNEQAVFNFSITKELVIEDKKVEDKEIKDKKYENEVIYENIEEQKIEPLVINDMSNNQRIPLLEPISQLKGTYIIAQGEKGLYLIDQHAAHERIQYEKNLNNLNTEEITSQELLIPQTMEYTNAEADEINNILDKLNSLGINIELFGINTFIVRAIPIWIPEGEEHSYIDKIIRMILDNDSINYEKLRKDLIASISCKSAIKSNRYLTKQEMEVLIEQLRNTSNPFSCPHGRPIIIHFSYYEIEKMFKRVI